MGRNTENGKVVCVSGATGYVASWLAKLLLLRGYTFNAIVRDPNDPRKIGHLLNLDGAKERPHLFKADLLEEGCFDLAVEGCEGVFHTASPCVMHVDDPQTELIDPAVKGTLNLLRSCAKLPSLKRVVLVASMAAIVCNGKLSTPEVIVDETWVSTLEYCRENEVWYALSKIWAKEAAWKFAKENNIDMVVIHP